MKKSRRLLSEDAGKYLDTLLRIQKRDANSRKKVLKLYSDLASMAETVDEVIRDSGIEVRKKRKEDGAMDWYCYTRCWELHDTGVSFRGADGVYAQVGREVGIEAESVERKRWKIEKQFKALRKAHADLKAH